MSVLDLSVGGIQDRLPVISGNPLAKPPDAGVWHGTPFNLKAVVTGGVIAQRALGDQRMLTWSDLPIGGSLWGVSYRPLMFLMIRSRVFMSRVGNVTTFSSAYPAGW